MTSDEGFPQPRSAEIRKAALQRPGAVKAKTRAIGKSGKRIMMQEKQRQAIELRKGGATYDAIAKAVGYSDASAARKAVQRAYKDIVQEPAIELKTLQIERLNHMLLVLWGRVQQGDDSAIRTSLAIMEKLDRLVGTEAAQQVDVNIHQKNSVLVIDGNKDDFIKGLRQMAGIAGDGTNKQIEAAPVPPQYDVIDAVVVDEEEAVIAPEPVQTQKPKKTYQFGVDPIPNIDEGK